MSIHFQARYGDPGEADGCLKIERYNTFNVAGKPQIQQGQH
jgi:hypothetical protein